MSQTQIREFLYSTYHSLVLNKIQIAKELCVSQATIDRMRKNGEIESIRIGGSVMFSIDEVARLVSA